MLFCSFHRVIVASLDMKLKLCMSQKIGVSRKDISQGFEKLCKRIKMNQRCMSEPSYTCKEFSNVLVFLPRWQIANEIICFKGTKRPPSSFGYDFLHKVAAGFNSRELFQKN